MPCFPETVRFFLPSPIVARKVTGSNPLPPLCFLDAATDRISTSIVALSALISIHRLLLRRGQAPVAMRVGTRLSRTEFTLLANLGATGRAPHGECLFFGDFHASIMRFCCAGRMVNFDHI